MAEKVRECSEASFTKGTNLIHDRFFPRKLIPFQRPHFLIPSRYRLGFSTYEFQEDTNIQVMALSKDENLPITL
jgi:hypothetical protein